MRSVFIFMRGCSDIRSGKVAGKAGPSTMANKQTNRRTLKVGGFHGRLFAIDWNKSRSVVCKWADAMGAFGPLMMGVVRRHLAILACPAKYGVVSIVALQSGLRGGQNVYSGVSSVTANLLQVRRSYSWATAEKKRKSRKIPTFLSPWR